MNLLYYHKHPLSNYFAAIREKNASEFRGAARGVGMSSNFRTFAQIFVDLLPRCGDFFNLRKFAPYVQKRLDTRPRCGYNGAGTLSVLHIGLALAQEDLLNCKKFGAHPQKRLDNRRFCTYSGASNTKCIIVALLLAPARQNCRKIKRFCRACFTWNIPESGFAKIARFPFACRCSLQRANPHQQPFLLIASCGHSRKAHFRHSRKISNK